jgi:hypothetical protein
MLQFGGHHLALTISIDGDRGVLTPTLTGAQPAFYVEGGKTVRLLGQESNKALALLNALDNGQQEAGDSELPIHIRVGRHHSRERGCSSHGTA